MASRLLYGSKPAHNNKLKPPEQPVSRPSALPRKSGIPAPPSKTGPSPSAPQSLPRGRTKNVDDRPAPRSRLPSAASSSSTDRASSKAPLKRTPAPPRSNPPAMGNFTEITAKPMPQRNRLRRKPSAQNQHALYAQSAQPESTSTISFHVEEERLDAQPSAMVAPSVYPGASMATPFGSDPALAPSTEPPRYLATTPTEFATSNSRMMSYVSRYPPKRSTPDLPHSGASVGRSSTPSTRLSESPGNFSRTSTPTSASSQSPSIMQAAKFATRPRPSISPAGTRPPVTRRKIPAAGQQDEAEETRGLPAVRESQTSSSSSSTVKGLDYGEKAATPALSKKSRLAQPPPTAPLRLSSKRAVKLESPASISSTPKDSRQTPASRLTRATQLPTATQAAASPYSAPEASHFIMPQRPSREDTPALEGANPAAPIIQSNLPQFVTAGQKRRDSMQRTTPSTSASHSARPSLSRSASITSAGTAESLQATAPGPSVTSPHLFPKEGEKSHPPLSMRTDLKEPSSKRDPSPLSASPARSAGRFGFFGRKIKSPSETNIVSPPKPEKLTKKGPAAGTGHEGYGRYARRGRSTSVGTPGARGRSISTDPMPSAAPSTANSRKGSFNNAPRPDLDEFFKERLEPITIGGGGQIRENRNSQTSLYQNSSAPSSVGSFESGMYATSGAPSIFMSRSAASSFDSQRESRELLPAPRLISTPQGIIQQERTLAHRRSLHRSQLMGEPEAARVPAPIDTNVAAESPAVDTYDSTVSIPQTEKSFASDYSEGNEGNWLRSKKKTPDRIKSPRKWNIFRRPHRSPERRQADLTTISPEDRLPVPANFAARRESAAVAHYELMDDDSGDQQERDLEQLLQSIEGNLDLESERDPEVDRFRERQPSALLPSPPLFSSQFEDRNFVASPKVSLNPTQSPNSGTPVTKGSRLQQVGRIPQVVSNRDRSNAPTAYSFSRPFATQSSTHLPSASGSSMTRPVLGLQTDSSSWAPSNDPATAPPANGMLFNFDGEEEFLHISPPKDSELTASSSSSGVFTLAPITAITPTAEDILSDDEIWNEYDELLDRVSPPIFMSPDSNASGDLWSSFPDLATTLSHPQSDYMSAIPIALSHVTTGPAKITTPTTTRRAPDAGQEEILEPPAAFFTLADNALNSPVSLSDLYSNYGNLSSEDKSNQRLSNVSATSGSRYSSNTIISESESPLSLETPETKRVTQAMAQKTAHASSDSLRFSALMTSRWLSFDRVLFSPAQDEILSSRQCRILVLDGLGNDDWSAYCALTYPDATVYNISPMTRKLNSKDTANSDSWVPPSNLRRMSHAGIAAPFPFPKGFFTAVVFRFPAADTPGAYKNAISECKRVLKPGGFLELCILDIDMMNTGSRARRAIRSVKERMQSAMPEVSLGPASDTVIKLLGRRGFENLNRCFVAVPLADSAASPTSGASGQPQAETTVSSGSQNFKDLLAGHEDQEMRRKGPKMMGRVGQWWWTRCYEKEVLRDGEPSLWDDKQLIAECEERQTSLRLVICCAQKPESVRRRTVSV